jgi:hypothetical protein
MSNSVKKNHIEYICPNCLKNFKNSKYHYEVHINKKYQCVTKNDFHANIDVNVNGDLKIQSNLSDKTNELDDKDNIVTDLLDKINTLIDQSNEIKKQNKEIIKQNEEFKEDIKNLKEDNEKIKSQLALSNEKNSGAKTNVNINIQINNFGTIDYNNIDKKLFIEPILNQFGKQIFLKMIKNVYINPNLPENHNLVITDKNRGYVKKYINGKWESDDIKLINLLVNEIVEHAKIIYDELKQRHPDNNKVKNKLNTAKKYIDLCDGDFLAELEEDENDVANKTQIKRCKEFYDLVYKGAINLFHDNKDLLVGIKNAK